MALALDVTNSPINFLASRSMTFGLLVPLCVKKGEVGVLPIICLVFREVSNNL